MPDPISESDSAQSQDVTKISMPKWGLSMTEGRLIDWLVAEGDEVDVGTEIAEAESEKIAGEIEAPEAGVLRRQVAAGGDMVPVGGLVGVIAPAEVSDDAIDAFVEQFQANFVPPEDAEDAAPPTQTIAVGDHNLHYLVLGDSDADAHPVVCVHGFGGDLNNWLFTTEKLSRSHVTYAVDLPGHGASDKNVSSFSDLVAALRGFLDAIDLDRVHLVGHSMGGAVALRVGADQPERMASLTLIDSAGLGDDINDEYISGFVNATRRRELKGVLQLLFAEPDLVTRQLVDDVLKYKRKDGVDTALEALAQDMFPEGAQTVDLRDELADLDVPTQVIWGAQDQVLPASHAEGLPDNVEVHVLDGQGHSPHMEAAGEVNRLIDYILSQFTKE